MPGKHFTWTPPAEIDGEPDEVQDIVEQQLVDLATVSALLAADSYVQLRAAGLEACESLEEWEQSAAGAAAAQVRATGLAFARSIRALRLGPLRSGSSSPSS